MVNKYPIRCHYCSARVPAHGGRVWSWRGRWYGAHLTCQSEKAPRVRSFYFPSTGETMTQNVNGRCEDAPCCGCCT